MATIHVNIQLKAGDTVNGLSGLKNCESGRGINLRLDGKALPPQGWLSPCSSSVDEIPPKVWRLTVFTSRAASEDGVQTFRYFRTWEEMLAAAQLYITAAKPFEYNDTRYVGKYANNPRLEINKDMDVVTVEYAYEWDDKRKRLGVVLAQERASTSIDWRKALAD